MLYASQALSWIVVLIMDMQIIISDSLFHIHTQQIIIHKGLSGLTGELHHHPSGRVSVHVRVLTGNIIGLDVHDLEENITHFRLTGNTSLVTIGDIFLSDILTAALHQLHLHHILYLFHAHLRIAFGRNTSGNLVNQGTINAQGRMRHSLMNSGSNLLLFEADNTTISFNHCLNHNTTIFHGYLQSNYHQHKSQSLGNPHRA